MTDTTTAKAEIMLETPIGRIRAPQEAVEKYTAMSDEELRAEIKKEFIDPTAFAVYRQRFLPSFS